MLSSCGWVLQAHQVHGRLCGRLLTGLPSAMSQGSGRSCDLPTSIQTSTRDDTSDLFPAHAKRRESNHVGMLPTGSSITWGHYQHFPLPIELTRDGTRPVASCPKGFGSQLGNQDGGPPSCALWGSRSRTSPDSSH